MWLSTLKDYVRFGGIAIGGIVGLDIFFLAFISGASMNPARSLAPAIVSGVLNNLWLYWSATFIGTSIVAIMLERCLYQKYNRYCDINYLLFFILCIVHPDLF